MTISLHYKKYGFRSIIYLLFPLVMSCHIQLPQETVAEFSIENDNCTAPCDMSFKNSSRNATSYTWDFGDGISSTEENPNHRYQGGGRYDVKLIATGEGGSIGTSKTVTAQAPVILNAAFSIVNNNCTVPCTVSFTNQSSNASSYKWEFGDGTTSTQFEPAKNYTKEGNYTVTLTAIRGGETSKADKPVTIIAAPSPPVASFNITNNNCTVPCTVNFTNQSSNATSFSWDFGDGNSSTQTSPSNEYKSAGTFTVKLTANGPGGSNATQQNVTIKAQLPLSKVGDWTYGGSRGDVPRAVAPTSDGGFVVAGYSNSNQSGEKSANSKGGFDFWIVRINANGVKVWDKTYGGSGDDLAQGIAAASDGGFVVAGPSNSNKSGDKSDNSKGENDYWVIKIDANGNLQWDKTYGGDKHEGANAVIATNNGNFLIVGNSYSGKTGDKNSNSYGDSDLWLVLLDGNGNMKWQNSHGGSAYDDMKQGILTNDGNFLLVGETTSNASGDKNGNSNGGYDYWVMKVSSSSGGIMWDRSIGGSGNEGANGIIETSDGFVVGGSSDSNKSGDKSDNSKGQHDYWVVKVSQSGDRVLWNSTIGGSGDEGTCKLAPTSDGGILIVGGTPSNKSGDKSEDSRGGSDYWLVKINSSGSKLWDSTYGGNQIDNARAFVGNSAGEYFIIGNSPSNKSGDKSDNSRGDEDIWVVKVK